MAIVYPLSLPTSANIATIRLTQVNVVGESVSPFTLSSQVQVYDGQMWRAQITLPKKRQAAMEPWATFLTALRGKFGTFLLGPPNAQCGPRGTVSSCTLSGSRRNNYATVTMTGSLLAGDYIQLGAGASARLHKVLQDQSGNGEIAIWPSLRADYTNAAVNFSAPKGVFRLDSNETGWDIDNLNRYDIQFSANEVIG